MGDTTILVQNIGTPFHAYTNVLSSSFYNLMRLTHISLASFLWDISKQCRPRSDAAECGV